VLPLGAKIDGGAVQQVTLQGEYEVVAAKLDANGWICGSFTRGRVAITIDKIVVCAARFRVLKIK
jgi:hypothetical protein